MNLIFLTFFFLERYRRDYIKKGDLRLCKKSFQASKVYLSRLNLYEIGFSWNGVNKWKKQSSVLCWIELPRLTGVNNSGSFWVGSSRRARATIPPRCRIRICIIPWTREFEGSSNITFQEIRDSIAEKKVSCVRLTSKVFLTKILTI